MSKPRIFYQFGSGWCYRLRGQVRGPFPSDKDAAKEMKREAFHLRSIRRALNREPLTFSDQRAERLPYLQDIE